MDLYEEIKNLEIMLLQDQQAQNNQIHDLIKFVDFLIAKAKELEERIAQLESR